jgi:hypothetical protein
MHYTTSASHSSKGARLTTLDSSTLRSNGCYWPLVGWVWDLYGKNRAVEAADNKLNGEFDAREMNQLIVVGLWCCDPDCKQRPKIRQVLQTLKFEAPLPSLPPKMPRLLPFHHELPSNSSDRSQFHDSVPKAATDPGFVKERGYINQVGLHAMRE